MTTDLISIILPVYNGERFLRQSIESVINQTYTHWELIIVDDGSVDRTSEIATEYVLKDDRIYYYKNKENMRLPKTLNLGFSYSKGKYLTWTSDDNLYYPNALERMYLSLINDKKEFAFASCDIIDESCNIVECIMVDSSSKKKIIGSNSVGACFLYSRTIYNTIGEYDPDMTLVEDFDYWQRICSVFDPVCISEKLYAYRWHENALTTTMKKDVFNRTLEKMLLKNRPLFGKVDALSQYFYYDGLHKCRKNLGERFNQYSLHYLIFSIYYLFKIRIPTKLKRTWAFIHSSAQ